MKIKLHNVSHLISKGTLCWSPISALRSEFSYVTSSSNMIKAVKDYSRVHKVY